MSDNNNEITESVQAYLSELGITADVETSGLGDTVPCKTITALVSGGADSTALLRMAILGDCSNATFDGIDLFDGKGAHRIEPARIHVLHVNHCLRGDASDGDEEFVKSLCAELGCSITTIRCDVASLAASNAGSSSNVEMAGRSVRYAAAEAIVSAFSDEGRRPYIVTAHNANDRAETMLMSLMYGSGLRGLCSIQSRRDNVIRPLLHFTHEQLCEWLTAHGWGWREDATNSDTRYTRSYVRHEVLPKLRARNPRIEGSISRTCDIISDENALIERMASVAYDECLLADYSANAIKQIIENNVAILDFSKLTTLDIALQRRVLRLAADSVSDGELETSFDRIEECIKAIHSYTDNGTKTKRNVKLQFGSGIVFDIKDGHASFSNCRKMSNDASFAISWLEVTEEFRDCEAIGTFARELSLGTDGNETLLIIDETDTLIAALPTTDSSIAPIGMDGRLRSVSGLLASRKIPNEIRNRIPLLNVQHRDGSVETAWVCGIIGSETFRCGEQLPSGKRLIKAKLSRIVG